jgi:DNA-binding response OmpR family regulator
VRGNARVLVVEDESLLAETLFDDLAAAGLEGVGPAATVDAALALVERERIDAAILDVRLLGELSFPVAYALRRRAIPFLFLTSHARDDFPADLRSPPLIAKPYDTPTLLATLRGLLPRR